MEGKAATSFQAVSGVFCAFAQHPCVSESATDGLITGGHTPDCARCSGVLDET